MIKAKLFLLILPLFFAFSGFAQKEPSTWFELEFSKKINKKLKLEFNPELRLLGGFKMDSYILEGGLSYKLHRYLTVSGYYRYEDEYDYKKSTGAYKGQLSLNRIAFDAKSGFELKRFNFQFRLRYTNGLYATNNESEFRYRAKIDYDIKGLKLVPFASVELFHDRTVTEIDKALIAGGFKAIDKVRYTGGLAYNLNKNNEISLFYRLQDNRIKDEQKNILGLSYSHDF
ncbi:MAG: DUF2490 domain-containing protein [Bacteroidota bacterium]|nr:DUF2490 domain-containing protein [Bacteroidota bacterium]